jgi:hypothetical protein
MLRRRRRRSRGRGSGTAAAIHRQLLQARGRRTPCRRRRGVDPNTGLDRLMVRHHRGARLALRGRGFGPACGDARPEDCAGDGHGESVARARSGPGQRTERRPRLSQRQAAAPLLISARSRLPGAKRFTRASHRASSRPVQPGWIEPGRRERPPPEHDVIQAPLAMFVLQCRHWARPTDRSAPLMRGSRMVDPRCASAFGPAASSDRSQSPSLNDRRLSAPQSRWYQ